MDFEQGSTGSVGPSDRATEGATIGSEAVSGDRWAPGIETAGDRSTGANRRAVSQRFPPGPTGPARRVSDRCVHRRRSRLNACIEEIAACRDSRDDPIASDNCLSHLREHLQSLWCDVEGNPESEAFEEMVNVLQVAMVDMTVEGLVAPRGETIESVLRKLRDDPDLDDVTANELTQELIRGGIDVFREIG